MSDGPAPTDPGPGPKYGGVCPLCGEEYEYRLPEHLPCEGEKSN